MARISGRLEVFGGCSPGAAAAAAAAAAGVHLCVCVHVSGCAHWAQRPLEQLFAAADLKANTAPPHPPPSFPYIQDKETRTCGRR